MGENVKLSSDYVRPRDCVRIVGEFRPILEGLDYHLLQNGHKVEHLALLRELLVVCTLHHANRPLNEMSGWTVNLASPSINLFATADSEAGTVCGRVFTDNVKPTDVSRLHAQINRPNMQPRASIVDLGTNDALAWAEEYYKKSEQLPARFFRLGEDRYALVCAQHGHDGEWLAALRPEDVAAIPDKEELGPLERRRYRFGCGCDATIIRRIVRQSVGGDLEGLFEGEDELRVECPRCAAVFVLKRDEMEG